MCNTLYTLILNMEIIYRAPLNSVANNVYPASTSAECTQDLTISYRFSAVTSTSML